MTTTTATVPVTLVKGDDEVLLRDAAHELIKRLSHGLDPSLAVEEIGRAQFQPPESSEASIRPLVDAAQTPPFLTDRRVVVGRDIEMFTRAEQVAPLVAYLGDPLPTTSLILVWAGGRIPKSLVDAVKRSGEQIDTSPGRKVAPWVDDQVAAAGLKLDRGASQRLVEWLGDDPQRLVGVLATLKGTYGEGRTKLSVADIEPFLGEGGGVPPWELTDAIDKGDIPVALDRLHRMMAGGGRHSLQIMATLHGHYARMLQLDGARVSGEKDAAALLGMRGSTFPAKKALTQARRLGHDRIVRAIDLLATADLDLRGGKAWPEALVMEVLVARLARLGR